MVRALMLDPLYGQYEPDPLLADLSSQPEIQRLREVRLSNINSVSLVGIANVSRFEHSLGTSYLAQRVANALRLPPKTRIILLAAALLHDVGITPFGHLMEEAFNYAGLQFDHESRLEQVFIPGTELGNVDVQIFLGRTPGFRKVLQKKDYVAAKVTERDIFTAIHGRGPVGQLISGSVDLDNIDNICRMAYHAGIPFHRELPIRAADGFFLENTFTCYQADKVEDLREWLDLRRRMYSLLMTNASDFAAKSMLVEAVRLALQGTAGEPPILSLDSWRLTDSELIRRLHDWRPTREIVERLLLGDLNEVLGMFWVTPDSTSRSLVPSSAIALREYLAECLDWSSSEILVYLIRDKRVRPIDNLMIRNSNGELLETPPDLLRASQQVLVGVTSHKRDVRLQLVREKLHKGLQNWVQSGFVIQQEALSQDLTTVSAAGVQPSLL